MNFSFRNSQMRIIPRTRRCRLSAPKRASSLNRDVRIKESALKMTKRVISGKVSTGSAHGATLPHEKPLFFVYNPSTATKYAENAHETEANGPYGQLSAVSMTILRSMNLTGRKTAKNSNKGFQPTTHKLLARHTLSLATHRYSTVSGSRLTPDVG